MSQEPRTAGLGQGLPPTDIHAVSVSLPKWQDTVGWATKDPQVLAHLTTGYPRFYIHPLVQRLATLLLQLLLQDEAAASSIEHVYGQESRATATAVLFPHATLGVCCRDYLRRVVSDTSIKDAVLAFQVNFAGEVQNIHSGVVTSTADAFQRLCVVVFPHHLFEEAKAFWQHTGFGMTSRHALYWLEQAPCLPGAGTSSHPDTKLPLGDAKQAVTNIRDQISGLLSSETRKMTPEDVFLYPSGMSAIAHSASALQESYRCSSGAFRIAVFGFLYVDTFKVLSKVKQIECVLYGHASPADMDQLERNLQDGMEIHALYTEFPGNPLLGSLDLRRLYKLSQTFNFHVVVDDTVGTAVNLDLVPFCDMICTSLTKMFSGACNVMGGSLTICPGSKSKSVLHDTLTRQYTDTYFPLDLLVMAQNSKDFVERVHVANQNAEAIAAKLRNHPVVDTVFYSKGSATQHLYDGYRRRRRQTGKTGEDAQAQAGYGYLLSIRFVKDSAAIAFHDALDVAKGPSLGTNFTLCCPYTLLAHASELEWAAKFGVVEHLVRLSVGIEKRDELEEAVDRALEAAAKAAGAEMVALGEESKPGLAVA
ncbi:Cys/Met metabolism, pyridoxal phosphate-dependent enzyme [Metarhizium album ARSEF 1941]|uniref:Cys/Met metabolism, pyridoxal phosphate-dependent enzyme n=1 Tax=Metarhizium album (strain ARSEF 1941) TaxID=1081103 RepID=A0A0B2WV51_METAS|nr:Cys/Met metabolism, pyridoxal phosphate-dependent enzyme [Metarhizium album ARSEF 1941]KHN97322.1 Cys/Met metabolism, pyridoxal phosphate-dependent enzyme [Metarhizium album ARSEF 1941]